MLAERSVQLEVDDDVIGWLGDEGYDPAFGARPLQRAMQALLLNPLARLILEGKAREGDVVTVTMTTKGGVREGDTELPRGLGEFPDLVMGDKVAVMRVAKGVDDKEGRGAEEEERREDKAA
jgi:hypothetical protein